jgi:hydrogenase 3 maturation protease
LKNSDNSFPGILQAEFHRVAIVGVGNELSGDDAAGILVTRELSLILNAQKTKSSSRHLEFLLIDAGLAPEAFTGPLRRFQPDLVVIIDAAELGEAPGSIGWWEWTMVEGMSGSTHSLPPSVFAEFLIREFGCQVVVVGIQPSQIEFDQDVSTEVIKAVNQVVGTIRTWFDQ